ncbi:hypothetical protein NMG60_11015953 [Bertholletia excelsa]
MALRVLSALDTAKTQCYHFKAIVIAGMGMFTDAYDLFCIPPILRLIARIYYETDATNVSGELIKLYEVPREVSWAIVAIALLGTVIGKLVFGHLGDLVGRKRVYGLALMLMVLSSIGCGFSICTSKKCVLGSLGLFRFLMGVGIGGDYPLSATIMSEFANKRTRGAFIAAVFSMQGIGMLAASTVTMVVCAIFNKASDPPKDKTPFEADLAWRIILMIGAIPAALTFYWRMMMPETARYTALVEKNVLQAAKNMEKVLQVSLSQIAEDSEFPPNPPPSYPFFSKEFFRRHGRDLFSCSVTWLLLDIVFYSTNLAESQVHSKFLRPKEKLNVYEDAFDVAKFQALVAICSTIPGYWASVFFIDRVGRVKIQIMGFFFMALSLFAMGIPYSTYWGHQNKYGFLFLYGLNFFFSNFGPNTTTFIVPAELFPARFRSTCHGISGAFGKVGAIIGTVTFTVATHHDGYKYTTNKRLVKEVLVGMGGVCILGMIITYLFTRETTGRSLEKNENEDEQLCLVRGFPNSCMKRQSYQSSVGEVA